MIWLLVGILLGLMLDLACAFYFPRIVFPIPPGITPDAQAEYGLIALMSNLNAYSETPGPSAATAGTNINLTTTQVLSGLVILTAGASGGFTITLPATSAILSAMGPTIPTNGTFGFFLLIQNNAVGQTGTVTAGDASTTLSGTMTVATSTTRKFLVTVASATTLTVTNVGSLTL